jgi:Phage derived protein Gp49-like (DUF891)
VVVAIKIKLGRIFDFYALEHNGRCEILDFMIDIRSSAGAEFAKLIRSLDWTTDNGLMRAEERFKRLSPNVYEFKTRGGVRILCFLDGRSIIVLTNGFRKKKKYDDEIRRAENLRSAYLEAKMNNAIGYREELI